jgi:hypothetical protein
MSHDQFLIKKVNRRLGNAKGNKFGVKIEQLKHGGLKSSNYKTQRVKIKQLKCGEPKSHNNKT